MPVYQEINDVIAIFNVRYGKDAVFLSFASSLKIFFDEVALFPKKNYNNNMTIP